MEPVSALALVNTCLGITTRIGTITKQLCTLKEKYKQVERKVLLFETQLSAISTAITGLSEWLERPGTHDEPIQQELKRSLDSCEIVILVITEYLDKVQMQANKMTLWNKTRFLRDEGTIMEYEGMLRGQVQALSVLLHILSLPSRVEQQSQMDRFETTSVLNQARDSSSSLLWLRDAESARTVTSMATENMETVDMTFDFDELIVSSKVYRSTLASFLKQKIRGDKKSPRHAATGTTPNFPTQGGYTQGEIYLAPSAHTPSKETSPTDQQLVSQQVVESYFARWPLDTSSASNANEPGKSAMNIDMQSPPDIPTSSNNDNFPAETDTHEVVVDQNALLKQFPIPSQQSLTSYFETWPFDTSTLSEVQPKSPVSEAETNIEEGEKGQSQDDLTPGIEIEEGEDNESFTFSPSPSISDGEIDFEFVYALHTFIATVEGQANATKGNTLILLDDSNSYWWLIRVVKDMSIGYLPAEYIETPIERLARLNKHRNIDVTGEPPGDGETKPLKPRAEVSRKGKTAKGLRFDDSRMVIETYFETEKMTNEEEITSED